MSETKDTTRIAKNTVMLYIRMLFLMAISLYTSRVILKSLGVEDYGIYNAVAGFVTVFDMFTHSFSAAISRFITFELGHGDINKLKKVFNTSILVQVGFSILLVLISETAGLWFLNHKMNIAGRESAAFWVFQFSIITFVIRLISVPYNASIIAHEKMGAFAYLGILEGVLRLAISFLVLWSPFDRLVYYSLLLCLLGVLTRWIYARYCHKHFEECHFKLVFEKSLLKDITSFAGWNMIGGASYVLNNQGINVLINIFCGPIANAARGVSVQVDHAVQRFSESFLTAIRPQITKSYAIGDWSYMTNLIFKGSRFSTYLLVVLSIPLLIETKSILGLWLVEVPEYSVAFVRIILINTIINTFSYPLITAMLATGDIRNYQIIVGGMNILGFPLAYVLFKLGLSPVYAVSSILLITISCLFLRLIMLKRMINLPSLKFLIEVVGNVCVVAAISAIIPVIISVIFPESTLRCLINSGISLFVTCIVVLFVGCKKSERCMIVNKAFHILNIH